VVAEQLSELAVLWLPKILKQEGEKVLGSYAPDYADHLADREPSMKTEAGLGSMIAVEQRLDPTAWLSFNSIPVDLSAWLLEIPPPLRYTVRRQTQQWSIR